MTTRTYGGWIYALSLFLFFSSVSPLMMWVFMELNLIVFVYLMYIQDFGASNFKDLMLFYFLIQSSGSFMFLFSQLFMEFNMGIVKDLIFIVALTLKVGIFPLFFWILKLGSSLSSIILILILSLQKVPMFFVMFQSSMEFLMELLIFSFLSGSILIFFCSSIKTLLISSSISTTFWVYNFFYMDIWYFLFFNAVYFIILFSLYYLGGGVEEFNHSMSSFFNTLIFMFLCGIPPLSLFFMKFFAIFSICDLGFSKLFFFLIWTFTFISLISYIKFFYSTFFFQNFLYLYNEFLFKKMSILYFGVVLFPLFFLNYQSKLSKLLSSYLK